MDINGRLARRLKQSRFGRPIGVAAYRAVIAVSRRSDATPVMVNTLAKAGTHLVMSTMDAFPQYRFSGRHCTLSVLDLQEPELTPAVARLERELGRLRRGTYMTGHMAHHPRAVDSLRTRGVKSIHVVRDPRALVVSTARYMRTYEAHPLHRTVMKKFPDDSDLMEAVITGFEQYGGERHWRPLSERLRAFAPWLDEAGSLVIRFEDLIGESGGGSDAVQRESVARIRDFVGVTLDPQQLAGIAGAAFDRRSATFRSGEIDGWKRDLTPSQQALIAAECADICVQLGYDVRVTN